MQIKQWKFYFIGGKLPMKCPVGLDECSNKEHTYRNIFEWGTCVLLSCDIALGNSCVDVLKDPRVSSFKMKLIINKQHFEKVRGVDLPIWRKYCSMCFGIPSILGWITLCFCDYLERRRIKKCYMLSTY